MHERELGIHLLKPCILLLKLLDALKLAHREPAVFGLPIVERGIADLELPAEVFDLLSALVALQNRDDLCFTESGFLHGSKVRLYLYFQPGELWGS